MTTDNSTPIVVRNLHKAYGDFEAVRGIDLDVHRGEVFGLLGRNGAGKTTTIEILEGLRPRTSGDVNVLGLDPASQSAEIKDRIGVCLQATNSAREDEGVRSFCIVRRFYSRYESREAARSAAAQP